MSHFYGQANTLKSIPNIVWTRIYCKTDPDYTCHTIPYITIQYLHIYCTKRINSLITVKPTGIKLSGVKDHVVQGSNVKLVCEVTGAKPAAEVKWYNETNPIPESLISTTPTAMVRMRPYYYSSKNNDAQLRSYERTRRATPILFMRQGSRTPAWYHIKKWKKENVI